MNQKYITKSASKTQELGKELAKQILKKEPQSLPVSGAVILGLQGDLGGGKTTFLQGLARGLGVKEKTLSPTFVIQKRFKIKDSRFKNFYHIDCYRIKNAKEILELGFKKIISNLENIIAVEWSEKIKKILPKSAIIIKFKFVAQNTREILFCIKTSDKV